MARVVLGNKGLENAVHAKPLGESVVLLARSYDKLVRDLEYVLSHVSEENLASELRRKLEERDA
ncbi:MAG: hypothetical protein E7581_02205 [Ruminococcaceae bacterium]|nr:hypothetical protein [Oscillospiraceae bacterium]